MTFDVWEDVPFKTNNFPFYKQLNSSVFQISKTTLLFVNGETGSQDKNINFYIYDMEREKFI